MRIPQIRIQSTPAVIEIHSSSPQQRIQQPNAGQHIEQPQAKITMKTIPGRLNINQIQAWESMNIKHVFRRIEETTQKGQSEALGGVARRASEGSELMKIENGGNAIVSQAKRKDHLLDYQYNIGYVPPPFSVKINYQAGKVNINVNPQKVIHEANVQKPRIDYQAGDVKVGMKQHAGLGIDFVDIGV